MTKAEIERRKKILAEYEEADAHMVRCIGTTCGCGAVDFTPTQEQIDEDLTRTAEIRAWVKEAEDEYARERGAQA